MERRYELLRNTASTDLRAYNSSTSESLPYIVTIIDEYVDQAIPIHRDKVSRNMSHNITESVVRLAQEGKAVGIHVILATQLPSKKVITDSLKASFPVRIAIRTMTRTDSRVILDSPGAENLAGGGDMIFKIGTETVRIQGSYISPEEINRLTSYVESNAVSCTPFYLPEPDSEPELAKQ